jgi:hypothetical protein
MKQHDSPDAPHADNLKYRQLQVEKWDLIDKQLRSRPFIVSPVHKRSAQWRETANKIRDLRELELLDWTLLQAEIADNHQRGIQDLRPYKRGDCYEILLEYVANRKRKAQAVLQFAEQADKHGCYVVNSQWHSKTAEIIGSSGNNDDEHTYRTCGGHEGVPADFSNNSTDRQD